MAGSCGPDNRQTDRQKYGRTKKPPIYQDDQRGPMDQRCSPKIEVGDEVGGGTLDTGLYETSTETTTMDNLIQKGKGMPSPLPKPHYTPTLH